MIAKIQKNNNIKNYFNLTYRVTDCCNYHCPYCMQGNKPKKDTSPILIETISKQLNNIISELKLTGRNIDFHLIGGEVTIFDIKNLILKNIDLNNIYRFSMVTNLSRNVEYYIDLFEYLKNTNIRIKASFHPTETSKEDFINKMKLLSTYNVIVSLLITEKNYYNIEDMYNELCHLNIPVSISVERINGVPITTNSNLIDKDYCKFNVTYSNGEIKKIEKYSLLKELNSLKGYNCDINNSKLIIGNKGNLLPACSQQNIKGFIFNYKYKENNKNIVCNNNKLCTLYAINEVSL